MESKFKQITIYEHESLWVHKGENRLNESQLTILQILYGEKGLPYYNLIHKGVRFNENVGVLQVGNLIIEVLPKADRYAEKKDWRKILIGMLRSVGAFDIHAPSSSSLNIKSNFILDLYFELFIKEVEYLYNKGLIKKYRKIEGNNSALKGNILFSKQIQQNLIHKERFFIRHTIYSNNHILHQIIYKTLILLKYLNTNTGLSSRIGNLLLNFPIMDDVKINESIFNKIVLNRKTEGYKNAIEISRLLLLNYHPDLSRGKNHVLALMFDMNLLWEKFIYLSLRKYKKANISITAQTTKSFWQAIKGNRSKIRPDIVIKIDGEDTYVLDTKWKNIGNYNPTPDDLKQLYIYHQYYKANKVALVYPGSGSQNSGYYFEDDNKTISDKECSIITIPTNTTINLWQKEISSQIFNIWLSQDSTFIKNKNNENALDTNFNEKDQMKFSYKD